MDEPQERFQDHATLKRRGRRGKKDWKHGGNPRPVLEPRTMWFPCGDHYEYEVTEEFFRGPMILTGWYRCVGGRLADGRWPAWHREYGAVKYC